MYTSFVTSIPLPSRRSAPMWLSPVNVARSSPYAGARPPVPSRKRTRPPPIAPPAPPRSSGKSSSRSKSSGSSRAGGGRSIAHLALSSQERLPKVLARLGVTSRRGAEALIAEGRVTVNGKLPTQPGQAVDVTNDVLAVDGAAVSSVVALAAPVWLLIHKPRGYLCDNAGRGSIGALSTVARLISEKSLVPVGRIPEQAAGIVLFTNERGCVPELANPTNIHIKEWRVDVRGRPTQTQFNAITNFSAFTEAGEAPPKSLQVEIVGTIVGSIGAHGTGRYTQFLIRLRDSRHHVIQRLIEHSGLEILRMTLQSFGPVDIGSLKAGKYRMLRPKEVKALKRGVSERNI